MGRRRGQRKLTRRQKIAAGSQKLRSKSARSHSTKAIFRDPAFQEVKQPETLGVSVSDGVKTKEKVS